MENPTTLIVAIMYVTIVSIGLGNLLMGLSEIAGGQRKPKPDPAHLSWMILLLFSYLSFFWAAQEILEIDDWDFPAFVVVLVGPILLLFGTNLLVAPQEPESDLTARQFFLDQSGRFFLLLAPIQAWNIGLDIITNNTGPGLYLSAIIGVGLIALIFIKSYGVHVAGAAFGWVFLLTRLWLDVL